MFFLCELHHEALFKAGPAEVLNDMLAQVRIESTVNAISCQRLTCDIKNSYQTVSFASGLLPAELETCLQ